MVAIILQVTGFLLQIELYPVMEAGGLPLLKFSDKDVFEAAAILHIIARRTVV